MNRCPSCGAPFGVQPGTETAADTAPKPKSRTPQLIALLVIITAGSFWLRARPVKDDCKGGLSVHVLWKAEPGTFKPFPSRNVESIDPLKIRHIKLVEYEHEGNRTYGEKNDREIGHAHQPIIDQALMIGANAWYHEPSRFQGDKATTKTIAVIAHPAPMSAAIKQECFPDGVASLIVRLLSGGSAEQAGLHVGDAVCRIDGTPLRGPEPDEALGARLKDKADGDAAVFEVVRDGALVKLTIVKRAGRFGYWGQAAPVLD